MKNNLDYMVNRVIIVAKYSELKLVDSIMHEGDFIPCINGFLVSRKLEANVKKTAGELLQDIDKFIQKADEYVISIFTNDGIILQFNKDKNEVSFKKSIIDQNKYSIINK